MNQNQNAPVSLVLIISQLPEKPLYLQKVTQTSSICVVHRCRQFSPPAHREIPSKTLSTVDITARSVVFNDFAQAPERLLSNKSSLPFLSSPTSLINKVHISNVADLAS